MSVLKMYNPNQIATNTLVLHKTPVGCCGTKLTVCKYFYEGTGPTSLAPATAIVVETDEGNKTITFDAPATTPKAARIAIAKALKSVGYDPYVEDSYKGVVVTPGYFQIIGEAKIISITTGGVVRTVTAYCTIGSVCKFQAVLEYETDPGLLAADGGTGDQVGTTDGFAAGASAAVKGAFEDSLAELDVDYEKVEVMEDTINSSYVIKIHLHDGPVLSLDGSILENCGCYADFVGA